MKKLTLQAWRALIPALFLMSISLALFGTARAAAAADAAQLPTLVVLPDDGRKPLLDLIASARGTIGIAAHRFDDDVLLGALRSAASRGVQVRALLERFPDGDAAAALLSEARLRAIGAFTAFSHLAPDRLRTGIISVDQATAAVFSCDLTAEALERHRCIAVITQDSDDALEMAAVFQKDWRQERQTFANPHLFWSPERSHGGLLGLIRSAGATLFIEASDLDDPTLVHALGLAAKKGVVVKVLVGPGVERRRLAPVTALRQAGVIVRESPFALPALLLLADIEAPAARAAVGSVPLTQAALDEARGVAILVHDSGRLARLKAVAERDWAAAAATAAP